MAGRALVGCLLAAVLLLPLPAFSQDGDQDVLALVDRVDPFDCRELSFVKVATGSWCQVGLDPPRNSYRYGFLLEQRGPEFTVRFVSAPGQSFRTSPHGTPEHERVGHEPADLGAYARELERRLKAPDEAGLGFYVEPLSTIHPLGEALIVARACARRGLRAEADRLLKTALAEGDAVSELAAGLERHLVIGFADQRRSWETLASEHRRWIAAFPDDDHRTYVEQRLTRITRVIEAKRAARVGRAPSGEGEAPAIGAQIRALIEETLPVEESWVDGHYLAPQGGDSKGPRPAERMVARGFDAVPALIEALDSLDPTRVVRYWSRYGGSFYVLRVGWLAEEVLESICAVEFSGDTAERQAAWRSWWQVARTKGEEVVLAELAGVGADHRSVRAATRLLERWPTRVGVVTEGVRKAKNPWVRRSLVELVSKISGEETTDFLLEELAGGYDEVRVAAARALLERGRREGLDTLMRDWTTPEPRYQIHEPGQPLAVRELDPAMGQRRDRQAVAWFLLSSGDPSAVSVVAEGLRKRSELVHEGVMEALSAARLESLLGQAKPNDRPRIERSLEQILGCLLETLSVKEGSFGFRYRGAHVLLSNPRVADLAACCMSEFWPQVYAFDPTGPRAQRDRSLRLLRERYRDRQGPGASEGR